MVTALIHKYQRLGSELLNPEQPSRKGTLNLPPELLLKIMTLGGDNLSFSNKYLMKFRQTTPFKREIAQLFELEPREIAIRMGGLFDTPRDSYYLRQAQINAAIGLGLRPAARDVTDYPLPKLYFSINFCGSFSFKIKKPRRLHPPVDIFQRVAIDLSTTALHTRIIERLETLSGEQHYTYFARACRQGNWAAARLLFCKTACLSNEKIDRLLRSATEHWSRLDRVDLLVDIYDVNKLSDASLARYLNWRRGHTRLESRVLPAALSNERITHIYATTLITPIVASIILKYKKECISPELYIQQLSLTLERLDWIRVEYMLSTRSIPHEEFEQLFISLCNQKRKPVIAGILIRPFLWVRVSDACLTQIITTAHQARDTEIIEILRSASAFRVNPILQRLETDQRV